MRIVFAGTPEVAVPALQALLDSRHDVVAVVTRPDAPAGRGRKLVASPIADLAAEHGIETLKPAKPRDEDFLERLRAIAPDCAPVVAYGALVPRVALDIPRHGWVNLHFSLLPAWRGAAPVQHAVMHGDEVSGASTFLLEEGMDTGPVFGVLTESVRPTDTSGDLLGRLAVSGAELLVRTLDGIEEGILVPEIQPLDGVSLAPKVSVEDAHVDWTQPALAIDRLIRGCTPAPGPWTTFRDERLKLGPIELTDIGDLKPGELAVSKAEVLVGTGSGTAVRLREVQPQGKRMMPVKDWANGARPKSGNRAGNYRKPNPDPARRTAFEALRLVDERDGYANLILPPLLRDRGLDERDSAFTTELVYGTLRMRGTYDAILDSCTDRPLADIDPPVLDVLRLGSHQLLAMRVPSHAAVSATVELARAVLGESRATFVNAVLRKVSAKELDAWVADVAPDEESDPLGHLAVAQSHPRWIVSAIRDALRGDLGETRAALEADNVAPQVTLVARPGWSTVDELLAVGGTAGEWSPYAVRLDSG